VILGKAEGQYSAEKQLQMLMEALRMTVPHFDLEEISSGLYSFEEVKIINQIAGVYTNSDQNRKAIEILGQLEKYIRKHYQNILQSAGLLPLISHNYARALAIGKRYEEAIEVAESGRQSCISYGHYQFLPGILAIAAECYHFLGKDSASKKRYYQAYILYDALDEQDELENIASEMKQYFNICVPIWV
jgi:hemerythrin